MKLSTRVALKFGVKTKEFKALLDDHKLNEYKKSRRHAFLTADRKQVVKNYPELKSVYTVKDASFSFYQDTLGEHAQMHYITKRNHDRSTATALEALDALNAGENVPEYTRAGRQAEAHQLKSEEMAIVREELNTSFDESIRINADEEKKYLLKFYRYISAYENNSKEALIEYPELSAIAKHHKQAKRCFSQWICPEHVDAAIKLANYEAINDLAKGIPIRGAEEISKYAKELNKSNIGTRSNKPLSKDRKNQKYTLKKVDLIMALIGRNGLETGWWPQLKASQDMADEVRVADKMIKAQKLKAAFITLPKEDAIKMHPELSVLYYKYDAAINLYGQKVNERHAKYGALALIENDYDRLIAGESLKAVSEYDPDEHERNLLDCRVKLATTIKDNEMGQRQREKHTYILNKLQETTIEHVAEAINEEMMFESSPENDIVLINGIEVKIADLQQVLTQSALVKNSEGKDVDYIESKYHSLVAQIFERDEISMKDREKLVRELEFDESQVCDVFKTLNNDSLNNLIEESRALAEIEEDEISVNGFKCGIASIEAFLMQELEERGGDLSDITEILEQYFALNVISEEDQNKLLSYLGEKGLLPLPEQSQSPSLIPDIEHTKGVNITKLFATAGEPSLSNLFESSHLSKTTPVKTAFKRWDKDAILQGLKDNVKEFSISLLGEPKSSDGNQLRFGSNKGSLVVTIEGEKKGLWFDHQTGQGGAMLNLIMTEKQCSFSDALSYAGEYLSLEPETQDKEVVDISDLQISDENKKKMIRVARGLANESVPIHGTLAEFYLKDIRKIDTALCSDNVRFLPSIEEKQTKKHFPALLVVGKDENGIVQGVQVTFLNQDGHQLKTFQDEKGNLIKIKTPKRSYGQIKGSAMPVHKGGSILAVAEGAETALSVATANRDLTVFASLGSLTNFSAMNFENKHHTIVVCADNDVNNPDTHKKNQLAINELQRKGFNVLLAKPEQPDFDFNDLLCQLGIEATAKIINNPTPLSGLENQPSIQSKQLTRGCSIAKKQKSELEIDL